MTQRTPYGTSWGTAERQAWYQQQAVQRSYQDHVLKPLHAVVERFDVIRYGALSIDPERYPLYWAQSRPWHHDKQTFLVTGGVHGYETSGVQGALRFLHHAAGSNMDGFNLLVAPCVSPWGYETINRWNPAAVDPNRSFKTPSPSEEATALMRAVATLAPDILAHIDLHETTDTDNTVFRPALAARDGIDVPDWAIPDGFYLVADEDQPRPGFQAAIINAVAPITPIAPADTAQQIIGKPVRQPGVIHYAHRRLGMCCGFAGGTYLATTEVYPDSPSVNEETCIQAQVAALNGGFAYVLHQQKSS